MSRGSCTCPDCRQSRARVRSPLLFGLFVIAIAVLAYAGIAYVLLSAMP
jgi:hypothetical protein